MFFALLALSPLVLFGQSPITGTCVNGGAYPVCLGGEVRFIGTGYPEQVHITIKNSSGKVIDDADYRSKAGVLSFMENLSFSDTYTIWIDDQIVLKVSTS